MVEYPPVSMVMIVVPGRPRHLIEVEVVGMPSRD